MSRIEQVMRGVEQSLMGLATTGINITRLRGRRWSEAVTECLEIRQGRVNPVDDPSMGHQQIELFFAAQINVVVNPAIELPEEKINQIESEIYAVLMANGQNFGLDFVEFVEWVGNGDPEVDAAEFKHGKLLVEYVVRFTHSEFSREF